MRRRNLFVATVAFVLAITSIAAGTSGSAADEVSQESHDPLVVRAVGVETFEANALISSTFRFTPERIYPHMGDRVTFVDDDETEDPHTITIVRQGQLPTDFASTFNCAPCNRALDAHFGGGVADLRVNVGEPGLDRAGDSLLLLPGASIFSTVTVPEPRNLSYLCAIHPWMQGRLVVG